MTAKTVNRNAIIRVYPALPGRKGNNSILSYQTCIDLIGKDLFEKNWKKFWEGGHQVFTFKQYGGSRFQFASK